jgi:hypothetical protein
VPAWLIQWRNSARAPDRGCCAAQYVRPKVYPGFLLVPSRGWKPHRRWDNVFEPGGAFTWGEPRKTPRTSTGPSVSRGRIRPSPLAASPASGFDAPRRCYLPSDFTTRDRLSSWFASAVQLREMLINKVVRRAEFFGSAPRILCCAAYALHCSTVGIEALSPNPVAPAVKRATLRSACSSNL